LTVLCLFGAACENPSGSGSAGGGGSDGGGSLSSAKEITGFVFDAFDPDVAGDIDEGAKTVTATVPSGTNLSALTPTVTHTGASVSPASSTSQDFSVPVTYTVTARNGSAAAYTVTVTPAAGDERRITGFVFDAFDPDAAGTIDQGAETITVTIPYTANLTLTPPSAMSARPSVPPPVRPRIFPARLPTP
jgi:hypothetical protein